MGQKVVYKGTMLEASKQIDDRDLSVYLSPIQLKLDVFFDLKTPNLQEGHPIYLWDGCAAQDVDARTDVGVSNTSKAWESQSETGQNHPYLV